MILILIAKEFTKGGHRKKVKRKSDHHMLVHIRWYFGTNLFDGIRFPIYVYHVTMFLFWAVVVVVVVVVLIAAALWNTVSIFTTSA